MRKPRATIPAPTTKIEIHAKISANYLSIKFQKKIRIKHVTMLIRKTFQLKRISLTYISMSSRPNVPITEL